MTANKSMICKKDLKYQNHKNFCSEPISKIEGYERALNDLDNTYCIHHRLETHKYNEETGKYDIVRTKDELLSRDYLKEQNLYFNRPAEELVYMTMQEHNRLHINILGKIPGNGGKRPCPENMKRFLSDYVKGSHWYNNGVVMKFCHECPDGFVPGRLKRPKEK